MAELKLSKIQVKEGVWHGELAVASGADGVPQIEVRHLDQVLDGVVLKENPDRPDLFSLSVPIPAKVLHDGVQTFIISDVKTETRLASFNIVVGQPVQDDIYAEIDLLREELDMLKRAFRRHCVETA